MPWLCHGTSGRTSDKNCPIPESRIPAKFQLSASSWCGTVRAFDLQSRSGRLGKVERPFLKPANLARSQRTLGGDFRGGPEESRVLGKVPLLQEIQRVEGERNVDKQESILCFVVVAV